MSVPLYMDVNVHGTITRALRCRGVDVLTAQEDNARTAAASLLDRASALGRVLFTHDEDLLREGHRRQREGERFASVTYIHQLAVSIGPAVEALEIPALAGEPKDFAREVFFL